MGIDLGVDVGLGVGEGVGVGGGGVGVGTGVGVAAGVGLGVGIGVGVGISTITGVAVALGVDVGVDGMGGVGTGEGVRVGVSVGLGPPHEVSNSTKRLSPAIPAQNGMVPLRLQPALRLVEICWSEPIWPGRRGPARGSNPSLERGASPTEGRQTLGANLIRLSSLISLPPMGLRPTRALPLSPSRRTVR